MPEITHNSQPDYDDWGWDAYWKCSDWIAWHEALKKAYGLSQANSIFITAYHEATFGAASYDCRTFSSSFKQYAKNNGFYKALFEGIGAIMYPVNSVFDAAGNVIDAVENSTATLKKLVPLALILALIIATVYFWKKANLT